MLREEVNSGGSQKRRLLDGKRPDLEARLVQILIARAQGMFIWVKLQFAVFFPRSPQHRMRLSDEVDNKLNALEGDSALPETDSLYKEIMDRSIRPGTLAREYTIRALQWILCAVEDLPIDELAKAISVDSEGKFNEEIDGPMILDLFSNFILVDETGFCWLSHLSAKGFLLGSDGDNHREGLFTAAESHAQLARCCLSLIANNEVRGDEPDGMTALHVSTLRGNNGITRQLLMRKVPTELKNCYGYTPLHMAALGSKAQHKEVIRTLLAHSANVNATGHDGYTALHHTSERRNCPVANLLIQAGAEVNAFTSRGGAALHFSIHNGDEDLLQDLLQTGANPNIQYKRDGTALHKAIYANKTIIAQKLLLAGADPLLFDRFGRTSLDWALLNLPMLDVLRPYCQDVKPTHPNISRKILRNTIVETTKELISKHRPSSYSRLGHCLLLCDDYQEASTAFEQSMINGSRKTRPSHPAVCDVCDDDERIKGVRFVCCTCADTDLCSEFMGRYHLESLAEGARMCQGHEFMRVPSDDREELPDKALNRAGETSGQWLTRLEKLYTAEQSKEC